VSAVFIGVGTVLLLAVALFWAARPSRHFRPI
jgi:hypothetical protein